MSLKPERTGPRARQELTRRDAIIAPFPLNVPGSTSSYAFDRMEGAGRESGLPFPPPSRAEEFHGPADVPQSSDAPHPAAQSAASSVQQLQRDSSASLWARVRREVASWRRGTVSIHDVDPWLHFNVFIRRGFRHRLLRKREAIGSMFLYLHNESFNIYSHLLAALLMLSLLLWPPCAAVGSSGGEVGETVAGMQDLYEGTSRSGGGGAPWASAAESPLFTTGGPSLSNRRGGVGASTSGRGREDIRASLPPPPSHVPSWLRSLHGLATANAPASTFTDSETAAGEGDRGPPDAARSGALGEEIRGHAYVPPGGGASPREVLMRTSGPASSTRSSPSWWSSFALVWNPSHLFSLTSTLPADADPHLQLPISVAARLRLSLNPLAWSLLLTFLLSCVYHVFMPCCRSRRGYQLLLQCDVMGVLLSIGGSACAYLTCGMPCASESAMLWATGAVTVSTMLCLYAVVLSPMRNILMDLWDSVSATAQGIVACSLCAAVELVTGAPLPPLPLPTASVSQPPRRQQQMPGRRHRGEHHHPDGRAQLPATYRLLLAWLHEHRPLHNTHSSGAAPRASAPPSRTAPPIGEGCAGGCPATAEPLQDSAHKRAIVMGVYCLLHLGIYHWFVYPKSQPDFGGFTQGVHYHNMSYLWLFLGGAANAARFPERVVFHWTRRAAQHARRLAAEEAASWWAEELARGADGAGGSPPVATPTTPSWWRRFSFPRAMIRYVVSASTLDYVGNSHNIWHLCTTLSALSNVLAVYYDCMEYDLVVCA
ncbi:hypothetical protein ABL78_5134 [Leptomonas seymouri]|uniref:Uncharacterized protein n=1 Tax=Leptomonas seymouri TaxID=5684 RepID=A0A0N0P4X6_LEPSE|nr:hypothetical protein ABL78_5134 [Leptomonas seymouri]|eukprot:KPI85806.1 hypothetical protein ABL78_5134 [Leptomonas seymouri]